MFIQYCVKWWHRWLIDWLIVWLLDSQWIRSLIVPMHLSLIDGPFMPHNLISTQESPVPFLKFQMAPIHKTLLPSEYKKGTQIYYFFTLNHPGKWTPSRFPNRVTMERDTRLNCIFTYLKTCTNIPLNKNFFSFKGPKKRAPLHVPQKWHPYGSRRPFPEP